MGALQAKDKEEQAKGVRMEEGGGVRVRLERELTISLCLTIRADSSFMVLTVIITTLITGTRITHITGRFPPSIFRSTHSTLLVTALDRAILRHSLVGGRVDSLGRVERVGRLGRVDRAGGVLLQKM